MVAKVGRMRILCIFVLLSTCAIDNKKNFKPLLVDRSASLEARRGFFI